MNEFSVQHHVFSSDGGYRTTFASPELTPSAIRRLEILAGAAQGAHSSGASFSSLSFDEAQLVASCTFVHGADHVGRRRLCTHSIVIPDALASHEAFNGAAPAANLFMTPEVPAERPGPYLAPQWPLLDEGALNEARRQALVGLDGHNQAILAGLYAPSRTLVIAGEPGDCHRRLGSAAWLLPREIRRNLFFRTGTWARAEAQSFGHVAAVMVSRPERLTDYPVGEFIPINLFDGSVPAPSHPVIRLLLDMQLSLDGHRRMMTLFEVLAAFPGTDRPTLDQLTCLARGYQLAEPALQVLSRGQEAVQLAQHSASTLLKAAFPLAKSGRPALAARLIEVLNDALDATERSVQKAALATLEAKLNESFQSHGAQFGGQLDRYRKRLTSAATANRSSR